MYVYSTHTQFVLMMENETFLVCLLASESRTVCNHLSKYDDDDDDMTYERWIKGLNEKILLTKS